ncbi:hypothetical protein H0H93_015574 [Arthromyces matolae]|nr:hypothetical protein H0H93_004575 [Arthromyces matolae]KAG6819091.1 hypothetical protein H0H93_015574 [Arthromyces matolae]
MFSRLASFVFVFALAVSVQAGGLRRDDWDTPDQQCTTGHVQCCDSVQSSDQDAVTAIAKSLGIVLPNVAVQVGLTCSPISLLATGGTACTAQTVCCEKNDFDGFIAIGCNPINIGK